MQLSPKDEPVPTFLISYLNKILEFAFSIGQLYVTHAHVSTLCYVA